MKILHVLTSFWAGLGGGWFYHRSQQSLPCFAAPGPWGNGLCQQRWWARRPAECPAQTASWFRWDQSLVFSLWTGASPGFLLQESSPSPEKTASDFEVIHLAGLWQYLCVAASAIVKTGHSFHYHSALKFDGCFLLRSWLAPDKKIYWNLFGKNEFSRFMDNVSPEKVVVLDEAYAEYVEAENFSW